MSAKSTLAPFPAIDAGDMSGNIIGTATNLLNQDNIAYHVKWTGTSPDGEIFIEVTNDEPIQGSMPPNFPATTVWTQLDFGAQILITGNTGSHLININQFPGAWVRPRYVRSSGSGALNAKITAKRMGG